MGILADQVYLGVQALGKTAFALLSEKTGLEGLSYPASSLLTALGRSLEDIS
jgi:hypothetical protein